MSDPQQKAQPEKPDPQFLKELLRDVPLFRSTAEDISLHHGMSLLEAAEALYLNGW